jgi:RimJ/RimL family protein N-acetyltransferase
MMSSLTVDGRTSTRLVTRRLRIRRARWADALALAEVFSSNPEFLRTSWAIRGGFDAAAAARYVDMESRRQNGLCLTVIERATHRIVGSAALLVPNPADGVPWIGLLIIAGDHQGAGLGAEAAQALERFLAERGWAEVRLGVLIANPRARRFWERLGYREMCGAWRCYNHVGVAGVMLSKPLRHEACRHGQRVGSQPPRASHHLHA